MNTCVLCMIVASCAHARQCGFWRLVLALTRDAQIVTVFFSHLFVMSWYSLSSRDRLSTVLLASEKPIVRSTQPQNFNRELIARTSRKENAQSGKVAVGTNTLKERLASQYRWSTTSGQAAAECALPIPRFPVPSSTLERHADPVRQGEKSSSRRREPNVWQQFAREWDMIQARRPMEPRTKPGFSL